MTVSTSPLAFGDCFDALDRALDDTHGIRLRVVDFAAGNFFRMRLHQARKLDRENNAKTYEPDHPMHGRSNYDKLMVRIKNQRGAFFVYIEQVANFILEYEALSEVEVEAEIEALPEPAKQQLIEPPKAVLMIEQIKRRV